jgi:hypothetical protein
MPATSHGSSTWRINGAWRKTAPMARACQAGQRVRVWRSCRGCCCAGAAGGGSLCVTPAPLSWCAGAECAPARRGHRGGPRTGSHPVSPSRHRAGGWRRALPLAGSRPVGHAARPDLPSVSPGLSALRDRDAPDRLCHRDRLGDPQPALRHPASLGCPGHAFPGMPARRGEGSPDLRFSPVSPSSTSAGPPKRLCSHPGGVLRPGRRTLTRGRSSTRWQLRQNQS